MCRLVSRHAITLWQFKRYVIFSGCADYSADMRKTKRGFDLRRIQNSDYSADTRKSIRAQEMWLSDVFAPTGGARGPHAMFSGGSNPLSAVLHEEIGLEAINF